MNRKPTSKSKKGLYHTLCIVISLLFAAVGVYWAGYFQHDNNDSEAHEFYYIAPGLVVIMAFLVLIANWRNIVSRKLILGIIAIQIVLLISAILVCINAPNLLSQIGSIAMVILQFFTIFLTWLRGAQLLKKNRKTGLPLFGRFRQAILLKPPERNVIFLGRKGSGKTHVLYQLKWKEELSNRDPKFDKTVWTVTNADIRPDPTSVPDEKKSKKDKEIRSTQMGYNNEVIKFRGERSGESRVFEFWDINGRDRWMWQSFYSRINFDNVVYFIDAAEYELALEKERNSPNATAYQRLLAEDRMEFRVLFNEPSLQQAQFFIYLNFHQIDELELKAEHQLHAHAILDVLEVASYGSRVKVIINNISGSGGLRSELVHL